MPGWYGLLGSLTALLVACSFQAEDTTSNRSHAQLGQESLSEDLVLDQLLNDELTRKGESGEIAQLDGFTKSEKLESKSDFSESNEANDSLYTSEEKVFEFEAPEDFESGFSRPIMVSGAFLSLTSDDSSVSATGDHGSASATGVCEHEAYRGESPSMKDFFAYFRQNDICGPVEVNFCIKLSHKENIDVFGFVRSPSFLLHLPCIENNQAAGAGNHEDSYAETYGVNSGNLGDVDQVDLTAELISYDAKITKTPGCYLTIARCPEFPGMVGLFKKSTESATHTNDEQCFNEAARVQQICRGGKTDYVTAEYVPTSSSLASSYTLDSACEINVFSCRNGAMNHGKRLVYTADSYKDEQKCMNQARMISSWSCENGKDDKITATFFRAGNYRNHSSTTPDSQVPGSPRGLTACIMEAKRCLAKPELENLGVYYAHSTINVHKDRSSCLNAAASFSTYVCENSASDEIVARYHNSEGKISTKSTGSALCQIHGGSPCGNLVESRNLFWFQDSFEQCANKAYSRHQWCKNDLDNPNDVLRFSFFPAVGSSQQQRKAEKSGLTNQHCKVTLHHCANGKFSASRDNPYVVQLFRAARESTKECIRAASDYHNQCANGLLSDPAEHLTAEFKEVQGDKAVTIESYNSSQSLCYLEVNYCSETKESGIKKILGNHYNNRGSCLDAVYHYHNSLCGNSNAQRTTASYYEGNLSKPAAQKSLGN